MDEKTPRYLKQVIVVRKDLSMPAGKMAAMAAHASMSFLTARVTALGDWRYSGQDGDITRAVVAFTAEQVRWLTELDPGLEDLGQVSMAKIVCQVPDEASLLAVAVGARDAGLECHRVFDSGYSHNKPGTFVCVAVGPDWPERLAPVTGSLKVYR